MSTMDRDGYISADQAQKFLSETLNVEFNTIQKPCPQNLDYLNCIIRAFMNKIPFQNFTLMCLPTEKRTLPSIQENVDSVLSGCGGLCWTNNTALFYLLKTLGFSVYMVSSSVTVRDSRDHIIIIANNVVKDGDTYLVEVGFGNPTFSAVCLDFEEESAIISHSYNTCKYIKREDEFIRVNKPDRKENFASTHEDWKEVYYFKLKPVSIQDLSEIMKIAYDKPEFIFTNALRAVIFNNNICTATKTTEENQAEILQEGEDHKLNVTAQYNVVTQKEELTQHLIVLFPMVPNKTVVEAVNNYLLGLKFEK